MAHILWMFVGFLPIFACLYFIKIEAHFFHWLQCIESGNFAHAASLNL